MKATSIKQIKFNRGQVSDLLSERVDMGLQNACGTVYDNTYINRYGQLENAPVIRLASNGVKNNETKIFMLFDTGTDAVLPIGIDYSAAQIDYYGWARVPSIEVKIVLESETQPKQSFTQVCLRETSKDYTRDGINYYAWSFNRTLKYVGVLGATLGKVVIDYVYTTTFEPTTATPLIVHVVKTTGLVSIDSQSIISLASREIVYTTVTSPNTTSGVYDDNLNYVGNAYSSVNNQMIYDDKTYYRDSNIDTTRGATKSISVYKALSKDDNTSMTDLGTPIASKAIIGNIPTKWSQFGYNVVMFDQNTQPILFNLVEGTNGWGNPTLTVKEDYFSNAFNNIYVRGLNTDTPSDFTVPTTGSYKIEDQTAITTKRLVTVKRNNAGGDFKQSLVGQVLLCRANGGALQVRAVEDVDTLTAYVLSPLTAIGANHTYITIPFENGRSEWIFGYENPFSSANGYPDSAIFANQRLIFGGNDSFGNVISVSRVGVLSDFDPESGTESDAFTTQISSKDFCRIVDFVVSNNELRIASTNGEYAINLANLTPSASLNGFDLRNEVGIVKGTPICDCGGITTYVSSDRNAVYGTQFNLLRDRYQPISLTSQTDNVVNNCIQLVYLKNRLNNEGNLVIGLNEDGSMFGSALDTNSGLVGIFKMNGYNMNVTDTVSLKISKLFCSGWALWGLVTVTDFTKPAEYKQYIVRFARSEFFNLPTGLTMPTDIAQFINQTGIYFRGLVQTNNGFDLVELTSVTDNGDGTSTVSFGDSDDDLFVAGFLRQADWRSVEVSVGMATRELNKNIVKLEAVISPQEFWNWAHTTQEIIPLTDFGKFFNIVRGREVKTIENQFINNTPIDIYGENGTLVWRRAFDNPSRELHYGISTIGPFLLKSITATVQYDEIQ